MNANPLLGVILHAIGGFAAGSFYIPYKKIQKWSWESYWLAGGLFSWIIAPLVAVSLIVPQWRAVLAQAPPSSVMWTYLFGVLWGVGGLTFGLSMRYLGLSLGYALALGFCAAFGTVMPPIFFGEFFKLTAEASGLVTLGGVLVCLLGIAIGGQAGVIKEREMSAEEKAKTIREFNFIKGLWIAIFAGVMSACMAFGYAAGKPIADASVAAGTPALWKNLTSLVVILWGGFTTNCLWCLFLNIKNKSLRDYVSGGAATLVANYFFAALAGFTWYLQFFFYGMGTTQMGRYDFSSWTIHMAFIIVFSSLWGIYFKEWKGAHPRARGLIWLSILVLLLSTVVVGAGNYLDAKNKDAAEGPQAAAKIETVKAVETLKAVQK